MRFPTSLALICLLTEFAAGQSLLDGTSFQMSTYNLPGSVGAVRLVDTADSNCRSEAGTPVGEDAALETCLVEDSGTPPVTMTFNGGPQVIGGLTVTPTVTPFAGVDPNDPIVATNNAAGFSEAMATWSTTGDLIELTMRTTENTFPSANEDDYYGYAATGIQYPNADPDSEAVFFRDEELETYNNFYFWFEDENGPIATGYDIFLPVGIGVGQHPIDDSREVVYIFYSAGEVDENTDTLAGGSLSLYGHGSDLDDNPQVGNLLFLADNVGIDGLSVTGFGLGALVQPPTFAVGVVGDCDENGILDASDLACVATIDERDAVLGALNTLPGDLDGDGQVAFSDFLTLSTNFNQNLTAYTDGNIDLEGGVAFADFLVLSTNFNKTVGAAAVPEPTSLSLFVLAALGVLVGRRKAARTQKRNN